MRKMLIVFTWIPGIKPVMHPANRPATVAPNIDRIVTIVESIRGSSEEKIKIMVPVSREFHEVLFLSIIQPIFSLISILFSVICLVIVTGYSGYNLLL